LKVRLDSLFTALNQTKYGYVNKGRCNVDLAQRLVDIFMGYSYGSAGYLALQATALLASPTMMTTLLNTEVREPSALEMYLCRALAITLLAMASMVILLTGSIPLTSSLRASTREEHPTAPYAVPVLTISLAYHIASAVFAYSFGVTGHGSVYYVGTGISALLGAAGVWVFLFGGTDKGRIAVSKSSYIMIALLTGFSAKPGSMRLALAGSPLFEKQLTHCV